MKREGQVRAIGKIRVEAKQEAKSLAAEENSDIDDIPQDAMADALGTSQKSIMSTQSKRNRQNMKG